MKLNPEFIMQEMQEGVSVLVPVGEAGKRYRGIIRLNETAAFLVKELRRETTREALAAALDREYEGTQEQFFQSIDLTLAKLREAGALLE